MKTLKELQNTSAIASLRKISHSQGYIDIGHSLDKLLFGGYGITFDFDVYLPKYGFNLQRPYVWNEHQQEELIWSMIYERPIPNVVIIAHEWKRYEVIDGKQRLMTIKWYINNEFPIHLNDEEIYFRDLDKNAQYNITSRMSPDVMFYYSYDDDPITDDEKIIIFNFFNFGGTPQEDAHREKLQNALHNI